jgi:glycosyltransferase involved in cell wall biosynthesis
MFMIKKQLTVIIPFLNEGCEIENTVRSIRETAGMNVDILLINDNSADDVDYEAVAEKFHASYYKNEKRLGVAESRNVGVNLIDTPFFVLIDGHMRFYHNNWWNVFIDCLKKNDRAVYSGNCLELNKEGFIKEGDDKGYGAFVHFENCLPTHVMEPAWITVDHYPELPVIEIPCVLGASYAMSVEYWKRLCGLDGLRYYGCDEPYLSLKIWLEGGACYLLKDVKIGHIFRDEAPYKMVSPDRIYNRLYISKMLLPVEMQNIIEQQVKSAYPSEYALSHSVFERNADEMKKKRAYYEQISTKDISSFFKINQNEYFHSTVSSCIKNRLRDISHILLFTSLSEGVGLMTGEMGEIVFLYEYAYNINSPYICKKVNDKLGKYIERLSKDISNYNFYSGIAGIGMAFKYLGDKNYIDFDWKDYFKSIETPVKNYMKQQLLSNNAGFMKGATGIAYFFMNQGDDVLDDFFIQKLEEFLDSDDYTLSDGILGVLSFLLTVGENNLTGNVLISGLIRKYVDKIKTVKQEEKLICESGDFVVAYMLLKASKVLVDKNLESESVYRLLDTCERQDPINESVWDASLRNGSAGTLLMYKNAYAITNERKFNDASGFWMKDILYKANRDNMLYRPYEAKYMQYHKGFYHGISGIGMSLMSLNAKEIPEWASWVLL